MAFSNLNHGVNIELGPDILDIQTTEVGFKAIHGESKVQLIPSQWPAENLPPSHSSLLTIASKIGIIAAAGPDSVVLVSTSRVRETLEKSKSAIRTANKITPNVAIPMSMRISHLTFSSDEKYLILSAENGGGLAVYEVGTLMSGTVQTAFEISTNGQALNSLIPNPAPEKGEILAMVTMDGNLMLVNLNERNFVTGPQGVVLKDNVSCISWSTKGKQIVAGLRDGSGYQMTPEGVCKSQIPSPPNFNTDNYVSSILWLENHSFLFIFTPAVYENNQAPGSSFFLVTRAPDLKSYMYQKVPDPTQPFGLNRSPPHHFLLRLINFPPNLQDAIILASTASTDIGLLTKSKVPLTHDKPPHKVTGVFTMTEMSDDFRRAQMPMSTNLTDTSPIGAALDLSSKDIVFQPIIGDEINETATPLPALMVLNNEGVLSSWWIIYVESIRQRTIYSGLTASEFQAQSNRQSLAPALNHPGSFGTGTSGPPFGTSGLGMSSPNSFNTMNRTSATFGTPTPLGSAGRFGAPSSLGKQASPWSLQPSLSAPQKFQTPTFGSKDEPRTSDSSFQNTAFNQNITPVFGQPSTLRPSWQQSAPNPAPGSFTGTGDQKPPFGTPKSTIETDSKQLSGFASFANKGGFAAVTSGLSNVANVPLASISPFGALKSNVGTSNIFGAPSSVKSSPNSHGLEDMKNFVLGTTFKADPSSNHDDGSKPTKSEAFFEKTFTAALTSSDVFPPSQSVADINEAEMKLDDTPPLPSTEFIPTTPTMTPSASRAVASTSTSILPNLPTPSIQPEAPCPFPRFSPSKLRQPADEKTLPESHEDIQSAIEDKIPQGLDLSGPSIQSVETEATPSITRDNRSVSVKRKSAPTPPPMDDPPQPSSQIVQNSNSCDSEKLIKRSEEEISLPYAVSQATTDEDDKIGQAEDPGQTRNYQGSPNFLEGSKPEDSVKINSMTYDQEDEAKLSQTLDDTEVIGDTGNTSNTGKPDDGDNSEEFEEFEDPNDDEDDYNGESRINESSDEGSGEDIGNEFDLNLEKNNTPSLSPEHSYKIITKSLDKDKKVDDTFLNSPDEETKLKLNRTTKPPELKESSRSPSLGRKSFLEKSKPSENLRSLSAPGIRPRKQGSKRQSSISTKQAHDLFLISLEKQKAQERRQIELRAEREAEERRLHELRKKKEAEEKQALVDQDDLYMQDFLASKPHPTTRINDFIAHSDYVSCMETDKIPAQVETVYRDINSMIDTLGLNVRSLKEFILGHTQKRKENRTRDDLEEDSSWVLGELESLSSILDNELSQDLKDGCVKDFALKMSICNELQKDLFKFRSRYNDIQKAIATHQDPDRLAIARIQPLGTKQTAQQHDIRRDFMNVQSLLSEAEESLAVLKAKIVSQDAFDGNTGRAVRPTIDAILRTISKLTNMAEKKSGDIDVLEGQVRKLNLNSPDGKNSIITPVKYRASHRNSSSYGFQYTPDCVKNSPLQNSLMFINNSSNRFSSPRRKLSGYTTEEKTQLRSKLAKKKQVLNRLRQTLQSTGVNVRQMDDDE